MSGFWTNNPCVPGWKESMQSWWSGSPPRLLHPNWKIQERLLAGCEIRLARKEDAGALQEFWSRYYTTSTSYKCNIPLAHIQGEIIRGNWEVWMIIHQSTQQCIGTGVRRWLTDLHIGPAVWKKAGMIDYFCVHPAWRSKGVGRWILSRLQNCGPQPLPPHLILWEGFNPSVPPLSAGFFWYKKGPGLGRLPRIPFSEAAWRDLKKGEIWSGGSVVREVSLWKVPCGETIAIWNTFHTTLEGFHIGVLVGLPSKEAAEEAVSLGPFGVLLSPRRIEGWTLDSFYQWIGYNMLWEKLGQAEFPCLAL